MLSQGPKKAIINAFRPQPEFSGLTAMPIPESRPGSHLLEWLDKSGLALSFLNRLQARGAIALISGEWRQALERRRTCNMERVRDMLQEFCRLNDAFRSQGVPVACLKGFTLVPDFCEDPYLRHQVDFDLLVDPANVDGAAKALQSCGYSTARFSKLGESCFLTPLHHVPSRKSSLYAVQQHRQVDLHVSLWVPSPWISLRTPSDAMKRVRPMSLHGAEFFGLSLEDTFLVQVLHVFRHSLRSWIRLSWLLEIGRCLEMHQENYLLWERVIERAGVEDLSRRAFALVLGLTDRLFGTPIPPQLRCWTQESITPSMRAWLDHFSVDWSLSDWPGSLKNLFLAENFIPDRRHRREYLKSRLLPGQAQTEIGKAAKGKKDIALAWAASRSEYILHRSATHLKDILSFPRAQIRWWNALRASRAPQSIRVLNGPLATRR